MKNIIMINPNSRRSSGRLVTFVIYNKYSTTKGIYVYNENKISFKTFKVKIYEMRLICVDVIDVLT